MTVTPIGFLIIPLGLVLFVLGKRLLLYAYIFSIPFSATAIINVGAITYGMQPSYYFMGLLCLHILLDASLKSRLEFHGTPEKRWAMLFLFSAVMSLMMPALIGGTLWVRGPGLAYHTVLLTISNFTQLGYWLFGVVAFLAVASQVKDRTLLINCVRAHLLGAGFVSVWGIYQFLTRILSLPYVELFNNSSSMSLGTYEFAGLMPKISSTAPESSIFASYQASVFPLVLVLFLSPEQTVLSKRVVRAGLLVVLGAVFLNLATTTYIALAVFLLVLMVWGPSPRSGKVRRIRLGWASTLLTLLLAALVADLVWWAMTGLDLFRFAWGTTLAKVTIQEGTSGWYRWRYFTEAFDWFLRYPLLGLGVGSVGSTDLPGTLLGSTGVMGLITFAGFLVTTLRNGLNSSRQTFESNIAVVIHGLLLSFVCLLFTMIIGTGALLFQQFWFLAGMLSAAASMVGE